MDGVHDMGGMHGFGPVVTVGADRSHHESWELRAQVVALLSGAVDRGSIEALDPAVYLGSSYYVRWLLAAETSLTGLGQIDTKDLERWRRTFADDPQASMPTSSDPVVVDAISKIGPHVHERASSTAFAVGQEVRVRRMRPEGHHRCPRYVRGAVGEIEKVVGADPVPGLQADQRVTEPCYTVRFSSTDLFGDEATDGEPPYQLLIDLWERYLEAIT